MSKRLLLIICLSFFLKGCNNNDDILKPVSPQIDFVKTFGGSSNERAQSVVKTNDGGYVVLGYTQSNDGDLIMKSDISFDYWLLKFDANDTLQWSKTFGGSQTDKGYKIIQTQDGGFALVGTSDSIDGDISTNFGWNDIWIVKLDSSGNISWEKSHGFSGNDQGFSIIQTSNGGYFISGVLDVSASGGNGNDRASRQQHAGGDYWGIKLDGNGNKVWRRYFGGTFTDSAYDAIQTSDNGFLLIGSSDSVDVDISGNKGGYDFWIVKVDTDGNMVWEKSFGGTQIDEAQSITKTNDGNYLILGDSRSNDIDVSNPKGAADVWLIKISETGNLIWEKSFGGSSFDAARSIKSTIDNGYLLAGSSRSLDGDVDKNQGQNDVWVVKIDNSGNLKWQKTIGGSNIDFAYDVVELNDERIIVVGESSSSDGDVLENKGFSDLLITKIKLE
ncbi:MAG: hypothetical protein KUG51_01930 [Urechidicola sp.]|nr:hypothetical protein [Urechidicola sp.]